MTSRLLHGAWMILQVAMALVCVTLLIAVAALWQRGALAPERIQRYVQVATGQEPPPPSTAELEESLRQELQGIREAEQTRRLQEENLRRWEDELRSRETDLEEERTRLSDDRRAFETDQEGFRQSRRETLTAEEQARLQRLAADLGGQADPTVAVGLLGEYSAEDITRILQLATPGRRRALLEAMASRTDELQAAADAAGATDADRDKWAQWGPKYASVLRYLREGIPSSTIASPGTGS